MGAGGSRFCRGIGGSQPRKRFHRDGLDGARGSRRARGGRAARSNAGSCSGGLRSADFRAAGVRRPNLATCPKREAKSVAWLFSTHWRCARSRKTTASSGSTRHLARGKARQDGCNLRPRLSMPALLPFHLKVLRSPHLFTRCDAGVLYLRQSALVAAKPELRDIYAHVEAELRSEVPAFTKSLAPGIGLANRPAARVSACTGVI